MITMTVYGDNEALARLRNNLSGSFHSEIIVCNITKTKKSIYEFQVPVQYVSQLDEKKNIVKLYFKPF